eukprot:5992481-Pyramimonas_sp.AAC.2
MDSTNRTFGSVITPQKGARGVERCVRLSTSPLGWVGVPGAGLFGADGGGADSRQDGRGGPLDGQGAPLRPVAGQPP